MEKSALAQSPTIEPIRSLYPYLVILALGAIAGLLALGMWGYEGSFLRLNSYHIPFLDQIMPHFTHLGQGVLVGAIIALFWIKKRASLVIAFILALLITLIAVGISKQLLFADWFRPMAVFGNKDIDIHHIALRNWMHFSFPSGHSTSAVVVFGFLTYGISQRRVLLSASLGGLTLAVIYSRLYIGVHFLGDILAGSLIGATILVITLTLLYPKIKYWLIQKTTTFQATIEKALYVISGATLIFSIYQLLSTYYFYD